MAFSHTITVSDESGVLSGVFVQVSTDTGMVNVIRSDSTSDLGRVTFTLDAGTYYAWCSRTRTNFTNPTTVTVNTGTSTTITGSAQVTATYYGTTAGASAMIPTVGALSGSSIPTSAQVITWLQAASAEIDRALAQAGYTPPVSASATAYPMFADLANLWAAARSLQALGLDNTSGQTETRSQQMMAEFWERLKAISGVDLSGLGLSVSTTATAMAQAVRRLRSIQISRVDKQHLTGGGSEYQEYWPAIHGLDS
jgi:hypothetical protein